MRPCLPFYVFVCAACASETRNDAGRADGERVPEAAGIPSAEYAARRESALARFPDGILVLHARSAPKTMEQWGFVQDATFQYFTGLTEVPAAILALDGPTGTTHLFLPPPPLSFGLPVEDLVPEPGPETASRLQVDSARPWTEFVDWLQSRVRAGASVYIDGSRRPEATGAPANLLPQVGDRTLWRDALEAALPNARVVDAYEPIMTMRSVKSASEIALLERNAQTTAASLLAVARRLAPGVHQRETEATMVAACLEVGGQGPSFWPWTMSGPNAHIGRLVGAFYRYDQGDRVAEAGDLVRVDIGCAGGGYGADVGRTLPVSGRFTDGQAEAWDLLIAGYRAGLDAMGDGVSVSDVRVASMAAVREREGGLTTDEGRAAAEAILSGGEGTWHIHGVGIESGEDIPSPLRAGMVLAYEPGFAIGADAYYLEDMILVTADGQRVLSAGLPYTAVEIEEAMER